MTGRPDVLACGEVACCLRDCIERPCTCGKTRYDCAVWSPFYTQPGRLHGWTHETLSLALLSRASERYRLLIDSSKTAWRQLFAPFKLRRELGPRFHLLHAVRDPRGVCWSTVSGAWEQAAHVKIRSLRHIRTSCGWWAANLSCELFGWFYPAQYTRVRYEDLVFSPCEVLDKLFDALLPGVVGISDGEETTDNRHQLYANHGRYNTITRVQADVRWKTEMPRWHKSLATALTWPLLRRYGY